MDNKIILVTGGAGFIGSNLIKKLVNDKRNIIVSLDNYSTGKKSNHIEGVEYIKGNSKNIGKHIKVKPHFIFHLGEYSRVEKSFSDIDKVFKYNHDSIYPVLKFASKNKSKIIYSGSSTKFDAKKGFLLSPYTWTKSINSELIKAYSSWNDLNYAIVYFYNVYGPNELDGEYGTLIGKFKKSMRNGKKLNIVLPGNQRRNFTHVSDIVEGLILISEKGQGDEFGIGNEKSFSIIQVADLFGGEKKFIKKRKGNREDSILITKKTEELGWKASHELIDYITNIKKNEWIDK